MRSSDLARLAGVSVRALRHYHQIGLLDEPPRGGNGYRRYDVHDLIQVLRIRRLAAVGIPLDRMTPLLQDAPDGAVGLLDDLDRELADQMERLTRQRELIARLRADRTPPDLPPELARFLTVFAASGLSTDRAKADRDESVLLAHLVGEHGLARLARLYERLTDPDIHQASKDFTERFDRLGPDSSDQDVDALVDGLVASLAPVISEFLAVRSSIDLEAADSLFSQYAEDQYNERQRDALERFDVRFDEHYGAERGRRR